MPHKILIIQTAFIGDVILSSSLIESLHEKFPDAQIDFLLRKGNESLLETNPKLTNLWIWNKSRNKFSSLLRLLFKIRHQKYDFVINIQRFFNSGFLTAFSGAKFKVGFHSNPLSFLFSEKVTHQIPYQVGSEFKHEIERNFLLAQSAFPELKQATPLPPKIYFNESDAQAISQLDKSKKYFVIAPSSVWYTKQWHISKWIQLIQELREVGIVYLIGAPSDLKYTSEIPEHQNVINLCGKLSLRQSALLMKNASRVFVNDSAPLHLASSVDAKTTAIFCSTVPEFGYTPLATNSKVIQLQPRLECMPCGLHGHKKCPKGHFDCALKIEINDVLETINITKS